MKTTHHWNGNQLHRFGKRFSLTMRDGSIAAEALMRSRHMLKLIVGTVKKSMAQDTSRWFRRNGSQVVDRFPEFIGLTMYLRIVSSQGGSY